MARTALVAGGRLCGRWASLRSAPTAPAVCAARALSTARLPPRSADGLNDGVLRHELVRLIGLDGKNRGVVAAREALEAARGENADLLEAKADAQPPVWRITPRTPRQARPTPTLAPGAKGARGGGGGGASGGGDKGEASKAAAGSKELRLTLGVQEHDLLTKVRQLGTFLEKQQRVRLTFRPAMRAKEQGDANALLARIGAELQHVGYTRKVTRKDASGKPLEVDFVPALAPAAVSYTHLTLPTTPYV